MCWQICALYQFTETTHRFTIVLWVLWDNEPALHKPSANGKAKTPLQSSPLWSPPQVNLSWRDLPALGTAHCQPCLHCSTHQHCWIRRGSLQPGWRSWTDWCLLHRHKSPEIFWVHSLTREHLVLSCFIVIPIWSPLSVSIHSGFCCSSAFSCYWLHVPSNTIRYKASMLVRVCL